MLEVVIGSASGAVHALSGVTGRDVAPFPFRTRGRITSRVLLARLRPGNAPGLHAVVQSFDGHLYAIDGVTGVQLSLLGVVVRKTFFGLLLGCISPFNCQGWRMSFLSHL